MIQSVKVKIRSNEHFTERERKLIEVFLLNMGVFVNALHTRLPMAMNPIESDDIDFGIDFIFQNAIGNELGDIMATDLDKRIRMMFDMTDIKITDLSVNAVQTQSSGAI